MKRFEPGDQIKCVISGFFNDETNTDIKRGKIYTVIKWEFGYWNFFGNLELNKHEGWNTVIIKNDQGIEKDYIDGWFEKI